MSMFLKRAGAVLAVLVLLVSSVQCLPEGAFAAKAVDDDYYMDTSDYLFDDNIIGQTEIYAYSLDELAVASLEAYYEFYEDDNAHNDGPEIEYDDTVYNIIHVESSDESVVGVSEEQYGYRLTALGEGVAQIYVFHYGDVQNRPADDELIYSGNYDVFTVEVSNIPSDEVDFNELSDKAYTGSAIKPAFKLTYKNKTLTEGEDYFLEYSNNVKVGTATVTATLAGYYTGVISEDFNIVPTIDKKDITVYYGTNPKLNVKTSSGITWKSGNNSVVKVVNGVLYPQSEGTATVTAKTGGYTLSCSVTVKKRQLNTAKTAVYCGTKVPLEYLGGTGTVTWKTSDKKVATVNSKGVVTTLKPGKVTITATRNGVSLKCVITVVDQRLNASKVAIYNGKYANLVLKGAVGAVKWKTSNSKIVAVNQKGLIKGKKPGKAVITAVHNGKEYKCIVTVVDQKLSASKLALSTGTKKTLTLKGAVGTVTWKTSNARIATVNSKGVVEGKKAGSAVITAVHGGKEYKCVVNVIVPKLNATKLNLGVGKYGKLELKGATETVKWKTGNSKIVVVNRKGLILGMKKGSTVISATHAGKVYKCAVTVK